MPLALGPGETPGPEERQRECKLELLLAFDLQSWCYSGNYWNRVFWQDFGGGLCTSIGELTDLDWALFFESLGKETDIADSFWGLVAVIPGCEVWHVLDWFPFFFFKLVWFSVRFLIYFSALKLCRACGSCWSLLFKRSLRRLISILWNLPYPFSFHLLLSGSPTIATTKPLVSSGLSFFAPPILLKSHHHGPVVLKCCIL